MMLLPRPFVSQSMCASIYLSVCVYVNACMMPSKQQVPELQNIGVFPLCHLWLQLTSRQLDASFQHKHRPVSFSAFTLWLCLIAVSSPCAFMRTMCFTYHNMAPWSFSHEEFLCGSNAAVFICAQGTGIGELLCGCPTYCRFCIFIKMLSIVLACAICCSMGNHHGFFPMTSSLVLHAFIL